MAGEYPEIFYKERLAKYFTGFKEVKPGLGYGKQPGDEKKMEKGSAAKKTAAMQTIKKGGC